MSTTSPTVGKLPTKDRRTDRHRTTRIGKAVNVSRHTYERMKEVCRFAESDPDRFGWLVEQMNRTGNVYWAWKRLRSETMPEWAAAYEVRNLFTRILSLAEQVVRVDPAIAEPFIGRDTLAELQGVLVRWAVELRESTPSCHVLESSQQRTAASPRGLDDGRFEENRRHECT